MRAELLVVLVDPFWKLVLQHVQGPGCLNSRVVWANLPKLIQEFRDTSHTNNMPRSHLDADNLRHVLSSEIG